MRGVKEEKREGKMGWGRRQGKEKKEEGREERKLSYKRGRIGCEEDFCCCCQSGNKRKRRECMRKRDQMHGGGRG